MGFSLGTILMQVLGFFLIPIYTRFLTPADYGILSITSVISAIFSIICIFGMRGAISRFYYDYYNDKKELHEYLSTICLTVFSVSFSLTILTFVFARPLFSTISPEVPFYPYIALALLIAVFGIPLNFVFILLQVREKSFTYSLLSTTQFLLSTSAIVILIVVYHLGALGSLLGQFTVGGLFLLVGLFLLRKDIGFTFNSQKIRETVSFGLTLVPHELAGWTTNLIDRLFLGAYTTISTVGVYSLGYQFGSLLGVITGTINYAWFPFFMSTYQESGDRAKPMFAQLTRYYTIILIFLALGIALFSKNVIQLIANSAYYQAIPIIPVIVLAFIFDGMYYMFVSQLFLVKKTGLITFSTLSAAVLNIIMNFILIPRYGMWGAALATVISYGFSFTLVFHFSRREFQIDYDYMNMAKTFALGIIVFLFSLFITTTDFMIDFLLKTGLVLLYLIGLAGLGILNRKEISIAYQYSSNEFLKFRKRFTARR